MFQAGNEAAAHDGMVVRHEQPDSPAGAGAEASAGAVTVREEGVAIGGSGRGLGERL